MFFKILFELEDPESFASYTSWNYTSLKKEMDEEEDEYFDEYDDDDDYYWSSGRSWTEKVQ